MSCTVLESSELGHLASWTPLCLQLVAACCTDRVIFLTQGCKQIQTWEGISNKRSLLSAHCFLSLKKCLISINVDVSTIPFTQCFSFPSGPNEVRRCDALMHVPFLFGKMCSKVKWSTYRNNRSPRLLWDGTVACVQFCFGDADEWSSALRECWVLVNSKNSSF